MHMSLRLYTVLLLVIVNDVAILVPANRFGPSSRWQT